MERTGRITTTAALLLCVATGSLLTSSVHVREISLGIAVGVLLDATIVGVLLVPLGYALPAALLTVADWPSPVASSPKRSIRLGTLSGRISRP